MPPDARATLMEKVGGLIDETRALPGCRESAFVLMKLQEAYLWLIEMRALEHEREDTRELIRHDPQGRS